MEAVKKSKLSKPDGYGTDLDEYFEDLNYLDSLDVTKPIGQTVDDIGRKYLPSTSKVSMISDTQTTENFMKEFQTFYTEMMGKVQGLKSVPALNKPNYTEIDNMLDERLFCNMKDTPEVQEQLKYIKKLDDEIKSVISVYETEKAERLETQLEMCNEITRNSKYPERDTELFLNLCEFEFSNKTKDNAENKPAESSGGSRNTKPVPKKQEEFIMRNIYLAKEGIYANSSLTDEEKVKLEEMLQEDKPERLQKSPFTLPNEIEGSKCINAYSLTPNDNKKLIEIDSELAKLKLDERSEKRVKSKKVSKSATEKEVGTENVDETEKEKNWKEIKIDENIKKVPKSDEKMKRAKTAKEIRRKNIYTTESKKLINVDQDKTKEELQKMNKVLVEKKLSRLELRLKEIQEAEEQDLEKLRKIEETRKKNEEETVIEDEDFEMPDLGDLLELDPSELEKQEPEESDTQDIKIAHNEEEIEEEEDKDEDGEAWMNALKKDLMESGSTSDLSFIYD